MSKYWKYGMAALLTFSLAACNTSEESNTKTEEKPVETATKSEVEEAKEIKLNYLGAEYTFSNPVENIVAASFEAMEDSVALGIKPVGVLEVGGKIPEYLNELEGATLVGNKRAPSAEAILALDPDAIIGTSKWGEDVMTQMNKLATTLPYSHISANWKDNLLALAELTNKTAEAEKLIADYEQKVADTKEEIANSDISEKSVLMIRVRGGLMYVYPENVYFNPILYQDLGLKVPDVVAKAEAQAEISLETLSEVDPDSIFLQFEETENADAPKALEELQNNAIFNSLKASKNGEVYVNTIAPLAEGGTAWSKTRFLDVVEENLLK
ncbi:ABC transporter substrate-binding protein [Robertmurraya massiliosenegalensis]|uniref:ABC transporter substrate-binding protein n=1 Tax=Robertmurraya massiliosenegalensis TaxID=1287657 RepID=UPI0002DDBCF4|nr:ABC transporter substrate-binding protein [Robertmurraya massiliosenegalensis]